MSNLLDLKLKMTSQTLAHFQQHIAAVRSRFMARSMRAGRVKPVGPFQVFLPASVSGLHARMRREDTTEPRQCGASYFIICSLSVLFFVKRRD